jgi:hypothetical protein
LFHGASAITLVHGRSAGDRWQIGGNSVIVPARRHGQGFLDRRRDPLVGSVAGVDFLDLHVLAGAGDRDRTGMTSLEGWGSTIELHPHEGRAIARPETNPVIARFVLA